MIKVTNPQHAAAVINEAKGFGIDTGFPEKDEDYILAAQQLYEFAIQAREEGMKGEHIVTIINLYESLAEEDEVKETAVNDQGDEFGLDDPTNDDTRLYKKSIEDSLPENMPVPAPIEGDAPNMPLDISELSDGELIRLHGAFSAYAARMGWLYSLEEAGEAAARIIRRRKLDEYIINADRYDHEAKKAKTQDVLKAEAYMNSEEVRYWSDLLDQHEIQSHHYKHVFEIYTNNVERLSRAWTLRQQERQSAM